jgi:hypothetical protein
MHTFVAVSYVVVKSVLAAVISKRSDYLFQFVGIPFIVSSALAAAAAAKCSLFSANAAQQRHNFKVLQAHGEPEGGAVVTAGRRVSGNHDNNATQNQWQIQNTNAHSLFAFTSALAIISSLHTAM